MSPLPRLALFATALVAALVLGAGFGAWIGPTPSTHPAPMDHGQPMDRGQPMDHQTP